MRALALSDKSWLDPLLKEASSPFSEYSFANLYLFRSLHRYEASPEEGLIQGVNREGGLYLMPLGLEKEIDPSRVELVAKMMALGSALFPLTQTRAQQVALALPFTTRLESAASESDYIYEVEHLASMAGRNLSPKRNAIKQLYSQYPCCFLDIEAHAASALAINSGWMARHEAAYPLKESDGDSARQAIEKRGDLALQGWVLFAGEAAAGYILGEAIGESFIVHFAKADPFYKGIYPALFQCLAEELLQLSNPPKFMNMEQDMGQEGLRQSKRSYQPYRMMDKYRLVRAL